MCLGRGQFSNRVLGGRSVWRICFLYRIDFCWSRTDVWVLRGFGLVSLRFRVGLAWFCVGMLGFGLVLLGFASV